MNNSSKITKINSTILKKTDSTWDGKKLIPINIKDPQVTVVRIKIAKGERLPLHKHPILNVGYLLKGELTIHTDSNETLILKANDSLVEVIDTWHYGENTGEEDVDLVVVYVGDQKDNITLLKE